MNKRIFIAALSAVFIAVSAYCADAGRIVTGGNISAEERAKIEKSNPVTTFETQKPLSSPDYASPDAWAALPDRPDSADVAPTNTKYPESQATAAVDVFFLNPTTRTLAINSWNIPIDDKSAMEDIDFIISFFASAFNAAAKVYAPRFRQANLYAFFDEKTDSGMKAIELAYGDIRKAFLYYIKHYNSGRPFILAGHSQGSIHGSRLLQEEIIGTPLMKQLVAAYLIGGTSPADTPGIQPSRSATDTGVLIGWNTYTKDGNPSIVTDGIVSWIGGAYTTARGRPLIQVNPLSWQLNGPRVPASENPGSLPIPPESAKEASLIPGVSGADASSGILIIDKPRIPGFVSPPTNEITVFNTRYGDYHNLDYQLFYESIRKNALVRSRAFLEKEKSLSR